MELDYNNFDRESKALVSELTKESDSFSKLIIKLQASKFSMNSKSEFELESKKELKK